MCGRYQLDYEFEQLMLRFNAQNLYIGYGAKQEIFPTDMVAIIIREGNQNFINVAKWGLDNYYDKRPLINARGETLDQKKTFKNLFTNSRCIIPASAFFEWKLNLDRSKSKTQISIKDIPVFAMAGLVKTEVDATGNLIKRCTIVTINASREMDEIHDRMPVILTPEVENTWLDNSISDINILKEFITPYNGNMNFKIV